MTFMENTIQVFKALPLLICKLSTSVSKNEAPDFHLSKKQPGNCCTVQSQVSDAFKIPPKLIFIHCVAHGICRLGVTLHLF